MKTAIVLGADETCLVTTGTPRLSADYGTNCSSWTFDIAVAGGATAFKEAVNVTLPISDGGSKITGSKVAAGGKSCTIKKTKTSCTIKGIKSGKSLNVVAILFCFLIFSISLSTLFITILRYVARSP